MERNPSLATAAKERDGFTCVKCGVHHSTKKRFDAHHIVPLHADGEDELSNLATLCPHCHRFAPEMLRDESLYEELFEDYIATGLRPELDLAVFAARAEVDGEAIQDIFRTVIDLQRSANDGSEMTQPEFYWGAMASIAEYSIISP